MYRYIFSFTLKLITATLQKLAIFHTWKCKTKGWWNGPKHTSLLLWWIYDYKSANLNKKIFYLSLDFLNPKTAWGGGGVRVNLTPPVVFRKEYLLKRGRNLGFLRLLILSLDTSFLEISLNFLKSFKRFEEILCRY